MPGPPEPLRTKKTPDELALRLASLRDKYKQGLVPEGLFTEFLKMFQFSDEMGRIWAPGATSGQWYLWNLGQWTKAAPPKELVLVDPVLTSSAMWMLTDRVPVPASRGDSAAAPCSNCGAPLRMQAQFCGVCGHPVSAQLSPPAARYPKCSREIRPGSKFCAGCGTPT